MATVLQELLEKCHPLGMFDSIATLAVAANMRELYRLVRHFLHYQDLSMLLAPLHLCQHTQSELCPSRVR